MNCLGSSCEERVRRKSVSVLSTTNSSLTHSGLKKMQRRHDGFALLTLLRGDLLNSGDGRRLRKGLACSGLLLLMSGFSSASVLQ